MKRMSLYKMICYCCLIENTYAEDPRRPGKLGFSVEVFDWEGTFKFQLKLSHPLKYPFWDAEKGFLYATDEEDCIRKYDVRDFL